MLYVGCSVCRAVTPLWCAGQFMPHMPVLVTASPMGPYCNFCGVLAPVFTCAFCWTRQMLYIPGAAFAPQLPAFGSNFNVAPAVQAPQGLGQNQVNGLLQGVAREFLNKFAGQLGQGMGSAAVSEWL